MGKPIVKPSVSLPPESSVPSGGGKDLGADLDVRKDEDWEEDELGEEIEGAKDEQEEGFDDTDDENEDDDEGEHSEADARWEEFTEADFDGQVALFYKTLDEPEVMDSENAFEMLQKIFLGSIKRTQRQTFDACAKALRLRLPDVYKENALPFLGWLIENRVAEQKFEEARPLALEVASFAGKDIDQVNGVLDQLAYHGQLSILVEMMRIGWPLVREGDGVVPWGVDRFAGTGADYEVFEYLEQTSAPDPRDPELHKRLKFYWPELDPKRVETGVLAYSGQLNREWTLEDFGMSQGRTTLPAKKKKDAWKRLDDNIALLGQQFVGYARREEGVSYPKAEIARLNIVQYIYQRNDLELVNRGSMLDRALNPGLRDRKQPLPEHVLCPDSQTMDVFLGGMKIFFFPLWYKISATFELVPAWLRFLLELKLIGEPQHVKALKDLESIHRALLEGLEDYEVDPWLCEGMKRWPEGGTGGPVR